MSLERKTNRIVKIEFRKSLMHVNIIWASLPNASIFFTRFTMRKAKMWWQSQFDPLHFIRGHFWIFFFVWFFYMVISMYTSKNFDVKPINVIVNKFMYFLFIWFLPFEKYYEDHSIKLFLFRAKSTKKNMKKWCFLQWYQSMIEFLCIAIVVPFDIIVYIIS